MTRDLTTSRKCARTISALLLFGAVAASSRPAACQSDFAVADQPAGLIVYPYVVADPGSGQDTLLELSNTSEAGVSVRCFYENDNAHCSDGTAHVCATTDDCAVGTCLPAWSSVDFQISLGAHQPIGWKLSQGLALVPLGGGTVPPVSEIPFVGAVRCIVVADDGGAVASNALIGTATVETFTAASPAHLDAAKYNAIGLLASFIGVDSGTKLKLGSNADTMGTDPHYEACPNILIAPLLFDGAADLASGDSVVDTTLVVVPCSVDYEAGVPGHSSLLFLSYDEFLGRYTSHAVLEGDGQLVRKLSDLDALAFRAANRGSLGGQTRFTSVREPGDGNSGVLALLVETHRRTGDPAKTVSAIRPTFGQGESPSVDTVVLPSASAPFVSSQTEGESPQIAPSDRRRRALLARKLRLRTAPDGRPAPRSAPRKHAPRPQAAD